MTIYLYKKTHNQTGLKYLGKTSAEDPHAYWGSGKRWILHIKKHGYDVTTEILKECETNEEVKTWGLYYSKLWNIVKSGAWANLREECGVGGDTSGCEAYQKKRHLFGHKGTPKSLNFKKMMSEKKKEWHRTHDFTGKNNGMYGVKRPRIICKHCGKDTDDANYKRWHGDRCKSISAKSYPLCSE